MKLRYLTTHPPDAKSDEDLQGECEDNDFI